jgi:hypothetical protein
MIGELNDPGSVTINTEYGACSNASTIGFEANSFPFGDSWFAPAAVARRGGLRATTDQRGLGPSERVRSASTIWAYCRVDKCSERRSRSES